MIGSGGGALRGGDAGVGHGDTAARVEVHAVLLGFDPVVVAGEALKVGWVASRQVVAVQVEHGERGEVAEFCGYRSCQVVAVQVEHGERGEVAEFCGYRSCQVVVVHP